MTLVFEETGNLALAFGGSSDFGLGSEADADVVSLGSSSSSDHCVLFFGTVSLGTAAALDGDCAPGGDNTFGTEVVFGNGAVVPPGIFGDAAFGAAAFGDAVIGGVTTDTAPFGSAAFGDIALGDGAGLGADAAFGEDGGLGTDTGFGSRCAFGFGTDFGSPVDETEVS